MESGKSNGSESLNSSEGGESDESELDDANMGDWILVFGFFGRWLGSLSCSVVASCVDGFLPYIFFYYFWVEG